MNLLNPLQIASRLKMKPIDVVKIINGNNIQSHTQGLRAGLYDLDEVQKAIPPKEEPKTEG